MLGMEGSLKFPRLRYHREDNLVHPSADRDNTVNERQVSIYTLDWEMFDLLKRQGHNGWLAGTGREPGSIDAFVTLPDFLEEEVRGYTFALTSDYHTEMRRNAVRARQEWDYPRSFDTMIRESCLAPAVAHARVAFYLLADCIWDPETKYWWKEKDLQLSTSLMAYKFWLGQTGRGLVGDHAGFGKLERFTQYGVSLADTVQHRRRVTRIQSALEAVRALEKQREEEWSLFISRHPPQGPVVEEETS